MLLYSHYYYYYHYDCDINVSAKELPLHKLSFEKRKHICLYTFVIYDIMTMHGCINKRRLIEKCDLGLLLFIFVYISYICLSWRVYERCMNRE